MICSACRRTVDPQRSFCRHCGSAVFIDGTGAGGRAARPTGVPAAPVDDAPAPTTSGTAASRALREARAARQGGPRLSKPAASGGCSGCLLRLVLLGVILWFVGGWLRSIPEVNTMAHALLNGSVSDDQLNAAVDAVRMHIQQLLGSARSQ